MAPMADELKFQTTRSLRERRITPAARVHAAFDCSLVTITIQRVFTCLDIDPGNMFDIIPTRLPDTQNL